MTREKTEGLLEDLRDKFELVLEDYAALHAELQALRDEAHVRHELSTFLLKAIAADLAAHRGDSEAHGGERALAGRHGSRALQLAPCPAPR